MIRVLWTMPPNASAWSGGVNYFCNLAKALADFPQKTIEPVIAGTSDNLPDPLRQLPSIPQYHPPNRAPFKLRNIRVRLERMLTGQDRDYDRYLRKNRIDLLSHLTVPVGNTSVPYLAWIPDFQHRYLPQYCSKEEFEKRNRRQARRAETAQGILLSSEDAKRDFNKFYPGHESKTHVLRFVAIPPAESELPRVAEVLEKHGIHEPYFHVPNQIWAHKNHGIILEALELLRLRGCNPLVISTGQTEDHRNPEFFQQLSRKVQVARMGERYRFLGLIPYPEVCVLMRSAVALINPSLFEGWSTTVEEAKSLGKKMLLSSLKVHREQAPDLGSFFDPHQANELALLIEKSMVAYDPVQEKRSMQHALEALPSRVQSYGMEYIRIVLDMVG